MAEAQPIFRGVSGDAGVKLKMEYENGDKNIKIHEKILTMLIAKYILRDSLVQCK